MLTYSRALYRLSYIDTENSKWWKISIGPFENCLDILSFISPPLQEVLLYIHQWNRNLQSTTCASREEGDSSACFQSFFSTGTLSTAIVLTSLWLLHNLFSPPPLCVVPCSIALHRYLPISPSTRSRRPTWFRCLLRRRKHHRRHSRRVSRSPPQSLPQRRRVLGPLRLLFLPPVRRPRFAFLLTSLMQTFWFSRWVIVVCLVILLQWLWGSKSEWLIPGSV